MSRYIDADRLKEEIDEWLDVVGTALVGKGLSYYAELIGCIEDCPTVDAVEVVRCRDCRYRERRGGIFGYYACTILGGRYTRELPVDDRFFCYYGERKVQE